MSSWLLGWLVINGMNDWKGTKEAKGSVKSCHGFFCVHGIRAIIDLVPGTDSYFETVDSFLHQNILIIGSSVNCKQCIVERSLFLWSQTVVYPCSAMTVQVWSSWKPLLGRMYQYLPACQCRWFQILRPLTVWFESLDIWNYCLARSSLRMKLKISNYGIKVKKFSKVVLIV